MSLLYKHKKQLNIHWDILSVVYEHERLMGGNIFCNLLEFMSI